MSPKHSRGALQPSSPWLLQAISTRRIAVRAAIRRLDDMLEALARTDSEPVR